MVVAVLLLPLVGVLLLVMDRIEDRMSGAAPAHGRPARHRGHLRLIAGGRREGARDPGPAASGTAEQEEPHGPDDVAGRRKTGAPQEAGGGAAPRREAGAPAGRDKAA
ncbi:hypothetical protein [Streptomyces sp. NRRL S-340]|uniref:hypothetical protein n=1 Tax=Streptomyces sp. NRRL S-340 TaxID=1463901 RepID=UPI0018FE5A88|nr:hypothetical protein [Streptomyces sp. NRRL S-340]